MFTFTRDSRIGNDNFHLFQLETGQFTLRLETNLFPGGVSVELVRNPVA